MLCSTLSLQTSLEIPWGTVDGRNPAPPVEVLYIPAGAGFPINIFFLPMGSQAKVAAATLPASSRGTFDEEKEMQQLQARLATKGCLGYQKQLMGGCLFSSPWFQSGCIYHCR